MRWRGETARRREAREREGVRRFALFPTQMHDGTWVWLEYFWECRREGWPPLRNRPVFHVYLTITREEAQRLADPPGPTTPPPKRGCSVTPLGSGEGATGGGKK